MPIHPQSDPWQENLKALDAVDPPLANQLKDLPIPDCVQPALGRDDAPTFQIHQPDGTTTWFGRTSMPTISAEGLLAQFAAGTGHVALAGIGTGLEAKLLSERLGRHRATFVFETEPLHLALALRLWDLSPGLKNHQIIPFLAPNPPAIREMLLHKCLANPGLTPPARLLVWPWREKTENHLWQTLLEEATQQVQDAHNIRLSQEIERLKRATASSETLRAIAVLTTVPGISVGRVVETLTEGACQAGFEAVKSWPDNPLRAGPLAGLTAAGDAASQGKNVQIMLVDQGREHWPVQNWPKPVIIWLTGEDRGAESPKIVSSEADWVVAATARQREHLLEMGWPDKHVLQALPFISRNAFDTPPAGPGEGIVLLHDLVPEDPEQAGITLYSLKVLWQAVRERLSREPDAWQPAEAQRWLIGAQTTTGTDLADPTVLQQFAETIQRCLAPSVILTRAAKAIVEAGLPLRLWGRGWEKIEWAKPLAKGPADTPQARAEVLRQAQVALLGDIPPGQAWLALEATAVGSAIMARALWPDCDPGRLLAANEEILLWTGQQQLVERLRHLLRNEPSRLQMARRARERALREHTAEVRIQQVMAAMAETGTGSGSKPGL